MKFQRSAVQKLHKTLISWRVKPGQCKVPKSSGDTNHLRYILSRPDLDLSPCNNSKPKVPFSADSRSTQSFAQKFS